MSRTCDLTGKRFQVGYRVSHSHIRTKHRFGVNLQKKRFWSSEKQRFYTFKVAASTMRSIDKIGFDAYARRNGLKLS
ncbi:MAG: 50S ribosomal protein L28 [Proteobacteria bacterium]|nr:50S ribosomal protein L28 [Pseudomonadota bacterium]